MVWLRQKSIGPVEGVASIGAMGDGEEEVYDCIGTSISNDVCPAEER